MDWEKIRLILWSALGGAIVLAVIGFNWGGWVTGGAAEAMAKEVAANAVAERLRMICAAQINLDSEKGRNLKKEGWATMPGDDRPERGVADVCAKHLSKSI